MLGHCWFGHLACKIVPEMTYYVSSGTLNPTHSLTHSYEEMKLQTRTKCRSKFYRLNSAAYMPLFLRLITCVVVTWVNRWRFLVHLSVMNLGWSWIPNEGRRISSGSSLDAWTDASFQISHKKSRKSSPIVTLQNVHYFMHCHPFYYFDFEWFWINLKEH